jgi:hypothetical protein
MAVLGRLPTRIRRIGSNKPNTSFAARIGGVDVPDARTFLDRH